MNKLLLTLGSLTLSTVLVLRLHQGAVEAANAAAAARQQYLSQTRLLAQAQAQRQTLTLRLKERREELAGSQAAGANMASTPLLVWTNGTSLSPARSEQLLAELGFSWRNQPDYVVVRKESLKRISLSGIKRTRVTDAACQVLAITPDERGALKATASQLSAEYNAWAQANVHREEPPGDVVAKYSLGTDPAFSQSLSNRFTQVLFATLGPERAELLQSYAGDWMSGLGMLGGPPTTLTVRRYGDRLNMEIRQAGNTMSTDVAPQQPFPAAFRPIFPGGWPDLAQRAGFELPKSFHKAP